MKYLRSLLFNFFIVFFADYLIPGVDVVDQTKIPHIGGDLIFAAGLGFLNSLVFPVLRMVKHSPGILQLSVVTLVLNFAAYALLKVVSLGVFVTNVRGYLIVAFVVSVGSILLSFIRGKRGGGESHHEEPPHEEEFHPPHSEE